MHCTMTRCLLTLTLFFFCFGFDLQVNCPWVMVGKRVIIPQKAIAWRCHQMPWARRATAKSGEISSTSLHRRITSIRAMPPKTIWLCLPMNLICQLLRPFWINSRRRTKNHQTSTLKCSRWISCFSQWRGNRRLEAPCQTLPLPICCWKRIHSVTRMDWRAR